MVKHNIMLLTIITTISTFCIDSLHAAAQKTPKQTAHELTLINNRAQKYLDSRTKFIEKYIPFKKEIEGENASIDKANKKLINEKVNNKQQQLLILNFEKEKKDNLKRQTVRQKENISKKTSTLSALKKSHNNLPEEIEKREKEMVVLNEKLQEKQTEKNKKYKAIAMRSFIISCNASLANVEIGKNRKKIDLNNSRIIKNQTNYTKKTSIIKNAILKHYEDHRPEILKHMLENNNLEAAKKEYLSVGYAGQHPLHESFNLYAQIIEEPIPVKENKEEEKEKNNTQESAPRALYNATSAPGLYASFGSW